MVFLGLKLTAAESRFSSIPFRGIHSRKIILGMDAYAMFFSLRTCLNFLQLRWNRSQSIYFCPGEDCPVSHGREKLARRGRPPSCVILFFLSFTFSTVRNIALLPRFDIFNTSDKYPGRYLKIPFSSVHIHSFSMHCTNRYFTVKNRKLWTQGIRFTNITVYSLEYNDNLKARTFTIGFKMQYHALIKREEEEGYCTIFNLVSVGVYHVVVICLI
jgi:hypothetical protein